MKSRVQKLLTAAVMALTKRGELPEGAEKQIHIERTRDSKYGDFASNIALVLAKKCKRNPRELAEDLMREIPPHKLLAKTEIAGPGFINFFIAASAYYEVINEIAAAGKEYGSNRTGRGQKILIEFVSANPTGPLHVGHGRGAAYGDAVARILKTSGYQVKREYYVNDAGRQMHILALSVWLRYLQNRGAQINFPANAYQGKYVEAIAKALHKKHARKLKTATAEFKAREFLSNLPQDDELKMDELIARSQQILKDNYAAVFDAGRDAMVASIKDDLRGFGVRFNRWFTESSLLKNDDIARAIKVLEKNNYLYKKDGATWFKSSQFGDEKDRAVVRANGTPTYFAADIAYHFNKGRRNFDKLVDVFGADHHGYAKRIAAAYQALGFASADLQIKLVQFVSLFRGGKKISMSTRGGEFVTLRELYAEVKPDAARFFYVARKNDQHMDFDLELAKKQSSDNPVFYIQYAHARISSIYRKIKRKQISIAKKPNYELLVEPAETELLKNLSRFPEVVVQAARDLEPHLVAYYLQNLANEFHSYYNAHPFLASADNLRAARLGLVDSVRQVIANGLSLLGVKAPKKM